MNSLGSSIGLWELPADTAFDRVQLNRWPVRYLQAVGAATGWWWSSDEMVSQVIGTL